MAVLLGVDVGTTNWKVAAFGNEGRLLAIRTSHAVTVKGADDRPYYDPENVWKSIAELIRQIAGEVRPHGSIDAVAVTGIGESVVAIDGEGNPVGQIVPWFDTRSVAQADRLRDRVGAETVFRITGLECNPIFALTKMMWTEEHQPDTYSKAAIWLPVVDFINFKLSGVAVTDYTEASRMLLLDLRTNSWSEEMAAAGGVKRKALPDIKKSGTPLGSVTARAARETGLSANTQVILGGHDHLCGSLAAGVLLDNRILDSSGTAESFVGFSSIDQPLPTSYQGLRLGRYLDPRRFVSWGGIIASGRSLDWAMSMFASVEAWGFGGSRIDYSAVDEAVAARPAGAGGLLYMPHLRGCGAPHWDPRSRGALVGLKDTHTQADCMRAVIEGLCFEARSILETTESLFGNKINLLSTAGGGTRSDIWQQIKADVTGKELEIPEVEESTVMGAALLGGVGAGLYRDLLDASRKTFKAKRRYVPRVENREIYDTIYGVYRQLYEALKPINRELTQIEGRIRNEKIGI